MRDKPRISYWFFWYVVRSTSWADFSLPLTEYVVRSTSWAAGDSAEGHVPRDRKNPNNTVEREASVYIGKKPVKTGGVIKKKHFGGGFFDSFFLQCLGVVA